MRKLALTVGLLALMGLPAVAHEGKECCKKAVAGEAAKSGHCDRKDKAAMADCCKKDGKMADHKAGDHKDHKGCDGSADCCKDKAPAKGNDQAPSDKQ